MIFIALVIIIKIYVFILRIMGGPPGSDDDHGDNPDLSWIAEDIRKSIDAGVEPCDDFYQFACGGWIKSFELKPSQSRFTRSFNAIAEDNDEVIKNIIQNSPDDSLVKKLYDSCMDVEEMDRLGIEPIQNLLTTIDNLFNDQIFSMKTVAEATAELHQLSYSPIFSLAVTADPGGPKFQIGWIRSSGAYPLPQSFYMDDNETEIYSVHIDKMFELVIGGENINVGERIVKIEKYLAGKAPTPTDLRNPFEVYHSTYLDSLKTMAPDFDWDTYFEEMKHVTTSLAFTVDSPVYINNVTHFLMNMVPSKDVRDYFKWVVIRNTASSLSKPIRDQHFNYFGKYISGQQEEEEREKICVKSVGSIRMLGFEVGKQFVDEKFPETYKKQALAMLGNVKLTFKKILDDLTWMDEWTKEGAQMKLSEIGDMIGFPDKWPDYSDIKDSDIKDKDWSKNRQFLLRYHTGKMHDEIGGNVDKGEWQMTPQQVNAYYEPTMNEMCFPAGILQYPFFSPDYPEAMNYGGVGSVIGHELSHAFDDEGSQYDYTGKLEKWWSEGTRVKFETKANCIRTQYSKFSPLDGPNGEKLYVNGNLTSGENIADNAGVKDAYNALESSIGIVELETGKWDLLTEYTNAQLFFIAFAQIWCTKQTDEMIYQRLLLDPHSPPESRVIGTLSNSREFSRAFQCEEGDNMNPRKKCELF